MQNTEDLENVEVDFHGECDAAAVHPKPIAEPIWRGSLKVSSKSFEKVTMLIGHVSNLACNKVLEEARHLPNMINTDLLQKSAVWPESFKNSGTNNQSIGLYFFPPQNERDDGSFDELVSEMIRNKLAIRVGVERADLLIFPSTDLPSQYRRFQSKYYLWGVFRRKQAPSKINDAGSGSGEKYKLYFPR